MAPVSPSHIAAASLASNINNNNNNNPLNMSDPNCSYKDVLLQIANQFSQAEKQPGSPQVSFLKLSIF